METLRNPDARRLWHWGKMQIPASDLDGIIEKRHNLLVLETKRPGELFRKGQLILLNAMVELGHTVCIVEGNPPDDVQGWELWWRSAKVQTEGNAEQLEQMVQRWLQWAEQHPNMNNGG